MGGSNVGFTSSLTFNGAGAPADKVWILQMTGDLIVGAGAIVTLANGAKAENIFWQVAGSTTLHTTAEMEGTILQMTGDLIVGAGAIVPLTGGAKAENIFWQVAGSTTLHT